MVEEGEVIEESSDDEELEEIIEEEISREVPIYPRVSSMIVPSLERMRIVETSLERELKDVEVEDDFENQGEYGAQENYLAGKDYDSLGDGDYESSIEIKAPRGEIPSSIGGIPPQQGSSSFGGGSYPGSSKRDGKKYHSHLEAGARDEEKKKKEKRMW